MVQRVYELTRTLVSIENTQQLEMLRILCQAAVSYFTARLREGLLPEQIQEDLVNAASLQALADYAQTDPMTNMQQIQLGDVTLRPGSSGAAADCLRVQAERIMAPHCVDGFAFRGV